VITAARALSCRGKVFTPKPWACSVFGLPPDVRRWLCPAVELPLASLGYALRVDLPAEYGHSPKYSRCKRRGEPRLTSGGKAVASVTDC
jgi:hypothetical protein